MYIVHVSFTFIHTKGHLCFNTTCITTIFYIYTYKRTSTQRVNYHFSWPPLPQLKARQFVYVTVRCFSS